MPNESAQHAPEPQDGALAPKADWESRFEAHQRQSLSFDPERPSFRELHALFKSHLTPDKAQTFLEIGCYPGRYAWYFHEHFDYQVSGLEYVESCAELARQNLAGHGIDARVICEDFLTFDPPPKERWDVVFSSGFVEHYELPNKLQDVVQKHYDLVRPGGHLVLVIPNHAGLNGKLLRRISPERYEMHNRMSYDDLQAAVAALTGSELVAGGYFGRFGFWNTGLYARLQDDFGPAVTRATQILLRPLEYLGRILPNNMTSSPNAAIIARRNA